MPPSYAERFEEAVRNYWRVRASQKRRQTEAGRSDAGSRGAVTGGAQMGAMADLVAEIFVEEGFPESSIQRGTSLELPGYYRHGSTEEGHEGVHDDQDRLYAPDSLLDDRDVLGDGEGPLKAFPVGHGGER